MAPFRLGSVPRFAFGLSLALAFPASEAQAAPARLPTHVACVGDSITAGVGDTTADGGPAKGPYPTQLQAILAGQDPGVIVQNFGHSGATLLSSGDLPYVQQTEYQQATSFVGSAGASAVVDVVIMLGTNDSKPQNWQSGASASQFTSDYVALVQHFAGLATNAQIYLMLPPAAFTNTYAIDGTIIVNQIDPLIRGVAAQEDAGVIDLYTPTAGQPQLFDDGVHPTDVGYTLIANTVADALLAPPVDAGAALDAGAPPPADAGAPVDATAPPLDSGSSLASEAGSMPADGSTPRDASFHVDEGGAPRDASTPPAVDAGPNPVDATIATVDSGTSVPAEDGAVATEDSGTSTGATGTASGSATASSGSAPAQASGDSGGCTCTSAHGPAEPMAWPLVALATAALVRRRRRAR